MRRRRWWALFALIALGGLAGCGEVSAPPPAAGQGASVNVSLKVVPTIRSVTVSPSKLKFGTCSGGKLALDTGSTSAALGFPNGSCWVGQRGALGTAGVYPITITNTGIATDIDVSGSGAVPSDDDAGWSLCNRGSHPAVACTNRKGSFPGVNQYMLVNFAQNRPRNKTGLTDTPTCDAEFSPAGRCWAVNGQAQREGIELIGPQRSSDTSTSWTVTITWTPVPR
jgi:hypothetical protein